MRACVIQSMFWLLPCEKVFQILLMCKCSAPLTPCVMSWSTQVAAAMEARGFDRTADKCKMRWFNLQTGYRRIRHWQNASGKPSYWELLNADATTPEGQELLAIKASGVKDHGLPPSFMKEVYDALDPILGARPATIRKSRGKPLSVKPMSSLLKLVRKYPALNLVQIIEL